MTKQKTISSLSIAAIVLVAAAVPALAQGQAEYSARNRSVTGAPTVAGQTVASNWESSAVRKSRVVAPNVEFAAGDVAHNTRSVDLSAAFKGQNNFTSAASSIRFQNAAPVDPLAKKQFRADETDSDTTRQMTFVASRGQKLPE